MNNVNLTIDQVKKKQTLFLVISGVLTLILLSIPFLEPISHVFNLFTTIIHETGHAIANMISGSRDISIEVNLLTTGGVTTSRGLLNGFTISAGYLGASLLGGLLLIISAYHKISDVVLRLLGIFLIAIALLFMIGHWATFIITLLFAGGFILLSLIKVRAISMFVVAFLAVQLIFNAFTDIINLIRISFGAPSLYTGLSDAAMMAKHTGIGTSWIWAIIYLILSLGIFVVAFKINRNIFKNKTEIEYNYNSKYYS